MDLKNVETFVKVAELQSFTKAAEELSYVQSTVTMQIKQLEKELGRVFVHEQQVDFIYDDKSLSTFFSVRSDPVQNTIQYYQHPDCSQLFTKFQNVIADKSVICINISLLCKSVE